jgi:hypothetical protein
MSACGPASTTLKHHDDQRNCRTVGGALPSGKRRNRAEGTVRYGWINIEPYATAAFAKETKGLNAIIEKGHKFAAMIEQVHSISVSDPLVAGSSFACAMHLDLTIKGHGRMTLNELCIYEVKDGKIISEQFTSRLHI